MIIDVERRGEVAVVTPAGRLDASTAPEFDGFARTLLEQGFKHVVLDCSRLEVLSSAGLQSLLHLARRSSAAGGAVVLCGLLGVVATVIRVAGFHEVMHVSATVDEAVASLRDGGSRRASLSIETIHGVTVLVLHDRLDALTAPDLDRRAGDLLASGSRSLVVDCAQLELVTSAGLRSLVLLARRARMVGALAAISGVHGEVARVLSTAGMDRLLPTFATRALAIAAVE